GGAHASAVNVGEVDRKARVPSPPAFGVFSGQVRHVLHCGAEARRAHDGAVCASQTSLRDLVPLGVLVVTVEKFLNSVRVQSSAHVARRVVQNALSVLLVSIVGGLM